MNNIDSSGKVAIVCAVFMAMLIVWSELRDSRHDRGPATAQTVTNYVTTTQMIGRPQMAEAFDRGILLGAYAALELAVMPQHTNMPIAAVYERVKTNPVTARAWSLYHP